MKRLGRLALCSFSALLCASLTGCTCYDETYYIGVSRGIYGKQIEPPQFYRFRLSGYSILTRSEFQSGWYDAKAVDNLFDQVITEKTRQAAAEELNPTATRATLPLPPAVKDAPPNERHYTVFGPQGERLNAYGKRFVILAAADPKAITDQIVEFTKTEELTDSIMSLLQFRERKELLQARATLDLDAAPQRAITAEIAGVRERLKTMKDADQTDPTIIREELARLRELLKEGESR